MHWLMFRLFSPSSSLWPFLDSHREGLFFTRLCAKEYIALSVMFLQKYSPRDVRCGHPFANAITLSSARKVGKHQEQDMVDCNVLSKSIMLVSRRTIT